MSSSPTDRDWIDLVDGELDAAREDALLDALVADPERIDELVAQEAALVYALGGLADGDDVAPARPSVRPHIRSAWFGALAVAAVLLVAITLMNRRTDLPPAADEATTAEVPHDDAPTSAAPVVTSALSRLKQLERRVASLDAATPDSETELLALAALGGARARLTTGEPDLARARLREVIRDFPGSSAARTASSDLARLEER